MRTPTILLLLILGTFVSVNAQKVSVGADPAVDVSKYKTYGWNKGPASSNPVIDQLIVTNVDREMASKGLTKVTTDPELTLVAFAFTDTDIQQSNPTWSPQLNSITTGIYTSGQSALITRGTLVVEMSDTKTKNGVWRGTAKDTLKDGPTGDKAKDAKTVEKPIKKAVEKMFKQFPKPNRK